METLFGLLSMQSGMKIDLKAPQFYLTPPQGSADVGEVEFRNVKFGKLFVVPLEEPALRF